MSASVENISLFIPRIFGNITKERISQKFKELLIGEVSRVDLVEKIGKSGEKYNSAYIHFNHWFETSYAAKFQASVRNTAEEARVIYDDPWFWIVLENTARKSVVEAASNKLRRKNRIDLTDFAQEEHEDNKNIVEPVKKNVHFSEEPPLNMEWNICAPPTEECVSYVKMVFDNDKQNIMDFDIKAQQMMGPFYTEDDFQKMGDLEDAMDEEDMYQAPIDSRYIRELETENFFMRQQIEWMQYENICLQNKVATMHQLYSEGIANHLPIGKAIELREKIGF